MDEEIERAVRLLLIEQADKHDLIKKLYQRNRKNIDNCIVLVYNKRSSHIVSTFRLILAEPCLHSHIALAKVDHTPHSQIAKRFYHTHGACTSSRTAIPLQSFVATTSHNIALTHLSPSCMTITLVFATQHFQCSLPLLHEVVYNLRRNLV